MDNKFVCINLNCAVYVFGHSSDNACPGCGRTGEKMAENLLIPFLDLYEKAKSRPASKEV